MKSHLISKGITLIAIEWLKLRSTYGTNWQTYLCKTPCPSLKPENKKILFYNTKKKTGREGICNIFDKQIIDLNSLSCVSLLFE